MTHSQQTRLQKKKADRKTFEALTRGNWQAALNVVQGRLDRLEHVDTRETTTDDQRAILTACRDFYEAVQPLIERYIDGEDKAFDADQRAAS